MQNHIIIAVIIGSSLGLISGIFFGNPLLGLLIGGLLGFKAAAIFSGRRSIHIRRNKTHLILVAAIAGFHILLLGWFFRPWFHDVLILFYKMPVLLLFLLSIAGLAFALHTRRKEAIIAFGILLGLSFLLIAFNDVLMQKHMVNKNEYNIITELPESSEVRLLPMAIAQRYLVDSLQKSREKAGPLDIIVMNGTLVWTAPRVPDGGILWLTQKVNGLLVADATTTRRSTRLITQTMEVGEGIGITDNIYWQVYKQDYFADVDDIFYIQHEGDIYAVASMIGYRFRFPVMVPYFKGVYITDKEGKLSFVDAKDTQANPILTSNKIYPESLARLHVDSYKYKHGWINAVFLHKDQIEISDVYGQANRQPFLMDTTDGLKWVVATEPWGQSYGIFKIFLVDAFSGRIDLLELDEEMTLTGPVRVVSYVRKNFPTIDWSTSQVIEPRPYTRDGVLYWMLSITPMDFAGVSYTVLVNSETNEVYGFQKDDELLAFLNEEETVREIPPESSGSSGSAYTEDKTRDAILQKIQDIENELALLRRMLG